MCFAKVLRDDVFIDFGWPKRIVQYHTPVILRERLRHLFDRRTAFRRAAAIERYLPVVAECRLHNQFALEANNRLMRRLVAPLLARHTEFCS